MCLGISVANVKPNFDVFLNPIVKELKKLEYGISFKSRNEESKLLNFFVLFGVFDKPARASILSLINSTGYYGCLKCVQIGDVFLTRKSNN
jgi:hypothetical protein